MNLLRLLGAISIAFLAASIYGCGGGASSPPAPPPTPTPIPFPTGGFTAATGAITTLTAASNGNFATTLLPASAAGAFIVQAGDSPAAPPQPGSIGQFSISADEWLGLTTLALARTPATSARPNERSIADAHRAVAAEGLHEIPNGQIGVEPLLRTFRPAPPSVRNLSAVRRPRAAVGDQHTFKILYSGIGGAQTQCPNPVPNYVCSVNVPATLEAISQHAYVWVDNTALANAQEFPDTSYFTAAASAFDQYFAIETQDYGPAFATANITTYQQCDSNGTPLPAGQYETPPDLTGQDPHINVIVSDALAGTGEGGYFYSGDFYAQQVLNCAAPPRPVSNEMPSVVIEGDNYSTGPSLPQYNPPYWLGTDMRRSMSHELQHFLHNVNKVYNRIANGLPFVQDNAWIDEGCSMLAEDLAAGAIQIDTPRYTYMYLLEPSQYSLTSFVGYQPSPLTGMGPYGYYFYTAGNYGAAYLFMRYL
ncbi:MAG: hypothetical protein JOY59_06180, partial [Candidatus Eremiobacteraeota bacterium]|nr:hypothetical protein [Candidatus Eremiobacteraeota bacterium]